jgi:hypothetical protein
MAKKRYDGVLEAAHFKPDGQLDWVRVYVRLGPIFSDRILMSRQDFIKELKAGKRYWVGERIHNMGGKFNLIQPVNLVQKDNDPIIVLSDSGEYKDELTGVPII